MYASCLLATGLRVVRGADGSCLSLSSMPFNTYYVRESLLQQVSERPRSTSRTLTEMRASQPACPPLHEHPAGAAPIFLRIQFPDMRSGAQAAVCKHSLSALWAGTASCLLPTETCLRRMHDSCTGCCIAGQNSSKKCFLGLQRRAGALLLRHGQQTVECPTTSQIYSNWHLAIRSSV